MENSKSRLIKIAEAIVKVCRRAKVPAYSCSKSKHVYRQEQHVAIVCMMKYFRLHYRSVVQLLELMPSMRRAIGISGMPHYTTVQKFFKRFSSTLVEHVLRETVRLFGIGESVLAVDSTGFSSNASSRYYAMIKYRQSEGVWRGSYVKNAASVDTGSQAIVSVMPKKVHTSDYMDLIPLAKRSSRVLKVGAVLADRGYDSEENNRFVRYDLRARNLIRVRTATKCRKRKGRLRRESELSFDWETYLKRNIVEMVFSVVKRKFGDTLYSRSLRLQKKELKMMCIVYNLHRYVNTVSCSIFSYVFYRAV
jgi:hypothetical protein